MRRGGDSDGSYSGIKEEDSHVISDAKSGELSSEAGGLAKPLSHKPRQEYR